MLDTWQSSIDYVRGSYGRSGDYFSGGDSLDDFLRSFPTVSREQAVSALEQAGEALKNLARAA